jgi:hypothetical protein
MGYNFIISKVALAIPKQAILTEVDSSVPSMNDISIDNVSVHVTIQQKGIAPFYYPLNLQLHCRKMGQNKTIVRTLNGVDSIIDQDRRKRFTFVNISYDCLNNLTFTLDSPYAFSDRPIQFAQQGLYNNETTASLSILNVPLPTNQDRMDAIQFYDISATPTIPRSLSSVAPMTTTNFPIVAPPSRTPSNVPTLYIRAPTLM